jgi:hypothetical protein
VLTVKVQRSRPLAAWLDRAAPSLAGPAAMGALMCVAFAVESGSPVGFILLAGLALVALGVGAWRRGSQVERKWDSPHPVPASAAVAGPQARRPQRWSWRVGAALCRVEARELACSPWFGIGLGLQLYFLLAFGVLYVEEDIALWNESIQQLVAFSHPLVGMIVVAAHAATTRPRHDGTEELFTSCPASARTRTATLLATAWVPAVAVAGFLGAFLGGNALVSEVIYGPAGRDAVPDLLGAVVLGVGGMVLGVALGRWVPSRLAPILGVVAVGALSLRMAADGGGWTTLQQLSSLVSVAPEVFLHRAAWWHLAWLVGLTTVVVGVALLRTETARPRAPMGSAPAGWGAQPRLAPILVTIGTAAAVVSGILATGPMPAVAADRLADRVARPAGHQRCTGAGSDAQVCAYVGYEELRDRVAAEISPVVAALPPTAGAITLRQVYKGGLDDLPPEVVRRLPSGIPPLPPGEVPLSMSPSSSSVAATRFQTAFVAVGLPTRPASTPEVGPRPEVVAGQARGVVALWLATRGLPPDEAKARMTAGRRGREGPLPADADAFERGFAWPSSCDEAPVVWSAQDLAAARALLTVPQAQVLAVLHAGWGRWRHPATGSDELLASLRLPPAGPHDAVTTRDAGSC